MTIYQFQTSIDLFTSAGIYNTKHSLKDDTFAFVGIVIYIISHLNY